MDKKLQFFTPFSIIESCVILDINEIDKILSTRTIQSTDAKEYDYIKDKSIKFFNNYDKTKLDQIR